MKSIKYILFIVLFISLAGCQDTENEILEMRVSHHKQTGYGFFTPRIYYRVQMEDQIGGQKWQAAFGIEDFEYQWGYTYDILVAKDYYEEEVLDAPSFRYVFLKELSKEKVKPGTQFDLFLKRTYEEGFVENLIQGDKENGFTILGIKSFECTDLCDELTKEREDRTLLTGTFEFLEEVEIRLVDLRSRSFK